MNPAISLFPIIFMVVAIIVGFWLQGRRMSGAPRQVRFKERKLQWLNLCSGFIMMAAAVATQMWPLAFVGIIILGSSAYELYRKRSEAEKESNWKYDRGRCGQCDYDLTYLDSPVVCPECGWQVPPDEKLAQRADWALWWRHWRLDYVDKPGMNALTLGGTAIACFAIPIACAFYEIVVSIFMLPLVILGIHMCINLLRIALYHYVWSKQQHNNRTESNQQLHQSDSNDIDVTHGAEH